ncbi:MAG: NAD-dependent epimerase/dehydratase family protein [Lentisphaeria bacterium]|nr:NAD-dependent epimerase/dehydratase family protein [Lentisphaeria bacterium]
MIIPNCIYGGKKMKAIVFGGTGYLGGGIVRDLVAHSYDVTACSRGKRFTNERVEGAKYIIADKNNEEDMRKIFMDQYDIVIDSVPTMHSVSYVAKYAKRLKHYLHCSSVALYTPLPYIPCDENAPFEGRLFPNGSEKIDTDREVMRLFHEKGFPATVIRSAYICSPGCYPLDNLGDRRSDFALDIASGAPLDVVNDGQALVQPIHVYDLAVSFRLAMENRTITVGECYNIAQEKAVTLDRYFSIMGEAFGKKLELHHLSVGEMKAKYGEKVDEFWLRFHAMHMCFTMEKAYRDLGYKPHLTTEEVIENTILWAYDQCKKK